MAKKQAVWGIDIGMCAIKALRCTVGDGPGQLVADKFDLIEFPKMLNQAEVDAEEEIRIALKQFLERNDLKGDLVAISVPGQMGLPRFFRPPPVDAKTLPDIVKYEVKQQIPFPIEDVIWDWQQLGGVQVEDRIVDAEVGLFAMKREAVFKALKPFDEAAVEVDFIQLSPLAVFNYVTHEVLETLPDPSEFDPENPPESLVVISMGTDTTDLIVTNGIKLWLRNIPVGGNHFTKQLSRELKLTHAKAEQLKRNVQAAEDPKSLVRAMRPVFNDLVNEVQRSLTFFRSIDKHAKLSKIVLLGNSAKLPGLRQYLATQLEMDIVKVSEFPKLGGAEVVGQSTFDENLLTFAPAYGLCLQGLKQGLLKTNLLPPEIKQERIIRAKKPWVLAAITLMMLGMSVGWFFKGNAFYASAPDFQLENVSWSNAINQVGQVKKVSDQFMVDDQVLSDELVKVKRLSKELVSASENRTQWIELIKAIHDALPKDQRIQGDAVDPLEVPFEDREEIYLQHIESLYTPEVAGHIATTAEYYKLGLTDEQLKALAPAAPAAEGAVDGGAVAGAAGGVAGPGWIIELRGHHFHNSSESMFRKDSGRAFLMRALVQKLIAGELELPGADNQIQGGGRYSYQDFGVYYPTLVAESTQSDYIVPFDINPTQLLQLEKELQEAEEPTEGETAPRELTPEQKRKKELLAKIRADKGVKLTRYDFVVQLVWIPRSPRERYETRAKRLADEKKAAETAAANAANATTEASAPNE